VLEGEFNGLLADVQPASALVELARAIFRHAWDQRAEQAHALRDQVRRRVDDIEAQIAKLLDNIVEVTSRAVVPRYEARINELERERLVMAERLETEDPPQKSFEEWFELTLRFLSNPWQVWRRAISRDVTRC